MQTSEATTNMVVALINNKCITNPEEVAKAFITIYKTVADPYQQY